MHPCTVYDPCSMSRDIKLNSPGKMISHIRDAHGLLLAKKQHIGRYQNEYPQFEWTASDGDAQLCCPSCMFITHEGNHQGLDEHFWTTRNHVIRSDPVRPEVVPPLFPAAVPPAVVAEPANLPPIAAAGPPIRQEIAQHQADDNVAQNIPPPVAPQQRLPPFRRVREDTRPLWNWEHIPSQQVRERLEAIAAFNNPAFIRRNPYWEIELEELSLANKPHLFHDYHEEFPDVYRDGSDEE
ncbi:hypothetical protein MBANPS3_000418 [Mucor bainieri]